jgi:hypothetical protein
MTRAETVVNPQPQAVTIIVSTPKRGDEHAKLVRRLDAALMTLTPR